MLVVDFTSKVDLIPYKGALILPIELSDYQLFLLNNAMVFIYG